MSVGVVISWPLSIRIGVTVVGVKVSVGIEAKLSHIGIKIFVTSWLQANFNTA